MAVLTTQTLPVLPALAEYKLAVSIYACKLVQEAGGLEKAIATYGSVANMVRIEVNEFRDRLGKKPLISVVLTCDMFDKGEQSIPNILGTISLFNDDNPNFLQVDPETIEWIKANRRLVADILTIINIQGVDIVYITDMNEHLMYEPCDCKQGEKPFNAYAQIKKIVQMYNSYNNNETEEDRDGYGTTYDMPISPGFFGELKETITKGFGLAQEVDHYLPFSNLLENRDRQWGKILSQHVGERRSTDLTGNVATVENIPQQNKFRNQKIGESGIMTASNDDKLLSQVFDRYKEYGTPASLERSKNALYHFRVDDNLHLTPDESKKVAKESRLNTFRMYNHLLGED